MGNTDKCPCCPRGCDLSAPSCHRGQEYAQNGGEGRPHEHHHPHHHNHPHHHHEDEGIDSQLMHALREVGHMLRGLSDGKGSQRRVIIVMSELGEVTQRELTEELGIQPGSASEVIAKLEDAGLLERAENEKDRRTALVRLTDSGKAAAETYNRERIERNAQFFSCLDDAEKRQLLALLDRICADWAERYPKETRPPHRPHGHHRADANK